MKFYGIDFGTNSCAISYFETDNSTIHLLQNKNRNTNIKSIVSFQDLNHVSIGESVEKLNNSFFLTKGKLGVDRNIKIDNKIASIQFCAALLLKYLKDLEDNIENVVITIPTFSDQSKKNALIESAYQAGFKDVQLIEEPTSAAMYHIFREKQSQLKDKKLLVFDFGAGTLDLSLVELQRDDNLNIKPVVKRIDGRNNFGGYLIDLIIADELLKKSLNENSDNELLGDAEDHLYTYIKSYREENNKELYNNDEKINSIISLFLKDAERVKIELSNNTTALINNDYLKCKIDREFVDCAIKNEIIYHIKGLLQGYKNSGEIDEVILVGGTSAIPLIQKTVKDIFGEENVIYRKEYINAVSYGASIINALSNNVNIFPFGNNMCTGILPKDIFIRCNGQDHKLLEAGMPYPLIEPKTYELKIPFSLAESIEIIIYEKYREKNYKICTVNFYHPCFYTGDIINLIVDIDKNGLIKFKAIHEESNEEIDFISKRNNSLNEKQIKDGRDFINDKIIFMEN